MTCCTQILHLTDYFDGNSPMRPESIERFSETNATNFLPIVSLIWPMIAWPILNPTRYTVIVSGNKGYLKEYPNQSGYPGFWLQRRWSKNQPVTDQVILWHEATGSVFSLTAVRKCQLQTVVSPATRTLIMEGFQNCISTLPIVGNCGCDCWLLHAVKLKCPITSAGFLSYAPT